MQTSFTQSAEDRASEGASDEEKTETEDTSTNSSGVEPPEQDQEDSTNIE